MGFRARSIFGGRCSFAVFLWLAAADFLASRLWHGWTMSKECEREIAARFGLLPLQSEDCPLLGIGWASSRRRKNHESLAFL